MTNFEILLDKIGTKNEPQLIPIISEEFAEVRNCFYNVFEKIKRDQGEIIYGWKIHKSPILIEAERHAIWKANDGKLIDITPDEINSKSILFIIDNENWKYSGQYIDNIRVNITNNSLVDDYILISETIAKLYQTSNRASEKEIILLEPILNVIKFLENDKFLREKFIYSMGTPESNCYCNGSEEYKNCHGKNLHETYLLVLERVRLLIQDNSKK